MARVCEKSGIAADDAALAFVPNANAIVLLPGAGLVARIACDPTHRARMRRELGLARYLAARGIAVALPAAGPPCPQLSVIDGRVVTWWYYLAHADKTLIPQLCRAVRALHTLPPPARLGLGRLDPFAAMPAEIEAATGIEHTDRERLRAHARALAARWTASPWPREPLVLLHGDAHPGNALRTPDGAVHLIDFEEACLGPWAWDMLTPIVYHRLGWIDDATLRAGIDAYGCDPREQPDLDLLVRIRLLRMTCLYAALTGREPHVADQIRLRIASLTDESLLPEWWRTVPPPAPVGRAVPRSATGPRMRSSQAV